MGSEDIGVRWQALAAFAQSHQCGWSLEPDPSGEQWGIHLADTPPHNRLLGPVFARGETCGLVVHNGDVVCRWGDTDRADMTFSVTKTCLALVTGVARDLGLIPDLDQPIAQRLPGIGFDSEHNQAITWRQMLQFTSEWSGSCFGVPDQVDHFRHIALQPTAPTGAKGSLRALQAPGTHWEYNDVRINQFSLALLHLFERSVVEVFDEYIMRPLGASTDWRWHGYDNSWVALNGQSIQSVPGGGHWGGGMVISTRDQARLAQLLVNRGRHGDRQLVSSEWVDEMVTPCDIAPFYGYFTWLNHRRALCKRAPESCFFAMGVGGQVILHDPENGLVGVYRWLDSAHIADVLDLTYEAL
ncbi:MAG: serine hydrolase domain-containing protein [Pseudomonadota bacterium]